MSVVNRMACHGMIAAFNEVPVRTAGTLRAAGTDPADFETCAMLHPVLDLRMLLFREGIDLQLQVKFWRRFRIDVSHELSPAVATAMRHAIVGNRILIPFSDGNACVRGLASLAVYLCPQSSWKRGKIVVRFVECLNPAFLVTATCEGMFGSIAGKASPSGLIFSECLSVRNFSGFAALCRGLLDRSDFRNEVFADRDSGEVQSGCVLWRGMGGQSDDFYRFFESQARRPLISNHVVFFFLKPIIRNSTSPCVDSDPFAIQFRSNILVLLFHGRCHECLVPPQRACRRRPLTAHCTRVGRSSPQHCRILPYQTTGRRHWISGSGIRQTLH